MKLIKVGYDEVKDLLVDYYHSLNGGFDDFFEDKWLECEMFQIVLADEVLGVVLIKDDEELRGIYLWDSHKSRYASVFNYLMTYGHVRKIFTVTNDVAMMNEILRHNFKIEKQAFNFLASHEVAPSKLFYRLAALDDVTLMKELFGDFMSDYKTKVQKEELYLGMLDGEVISLGNMTCHQLDPSVASIGMMVSEAYRNNGYGADTIRFMIKTCRDKELKVQAGCWFYNHASRHTLLKAGMHVTNMIVRVDSF